MRRPLSFLILAALLVAVPAFSQANTGKVSGRVTAEGAGLPGVLITAGSPALQGERTTITKGNGDYVLPLLPAGDYSLSFELEGFSPVRQDVKVSVNQQVPIDLTMVLSELSEEIVVTSETATISRDIQSQTTYEKDMVEKLAITRSIEDAVILAPGVHATGPQRDVAINGQAISISGSQSYENLFMVNGVVVNENSRGQAREFVIEDAVLETTITSSGVSAEYGRFNGGVVNVITRSGGNQFHGSVRASISQESWQGKNELSPDELDDTQNETYEATFGGRILQDKLWFFLAARDLEHAKTVTLDQTLIPLSQDLARDRAEAKLTYSPSPGHRVIGAYQERNASTANDHFSAIDLSTVNPLVEDIEDLMSINYTGVLTPNFFVEGQYSEGNYNVGVGEGATTRDRIGGTWIVDLTSFTYLASPVFCAVCVENECNNENLIVKGSYFLATDNRGTHDLVFGYDSFTDINIIENHQSGSDFQVWAFEPFIVRGQDVFPMFTANGPDRLRWDPVLEATKGMHFGTDSIFFNDTWRIGNKMSVNLGVRYDENDTVNGSGEVISDDSKISPRFGFSYDLKGDGDTVLNATYAQYAASINTGPNIRGGTGSAGALGNWTWLYSGPDINPDPTAANLLNGDEALAVIFAWFDSIGGVDNVSERSNLTIPGLGHQVADAITTPSSEEFSIGLVKRLGSKGLVRVELVHREFGDFYGETTDTTTGQVQNPDGTFSDLTIFGNDNLYSKREYDGLHAQFSYRFTDRLSLAGNWTLSDASGNFDGETEGNAALPQGRGNYPELKAFAANQSSGNLLIDQRHKVALWAIYDILEGTRNRLLASVLQRFGSGRPFVGSELSGPGSVASVNFIDTDALGYVDPLPTVNYWFYDRNHAKTDDIMSTDLALNYAFVLNGGGREFEIFIQPEVLNVFNEDAPQFVDATVLDATNGDFATFNPFTDTPVEGVYNGKGPNFGQATSAQDYQPPREFRFSVGFRF